MGGLSNVVDIVAVGLGKYHTYCRITFLFAGHLIVRNVGLNGK